MADEETKPNAAPAAAPEETTPNDADTVNAETTDDPALLRAKLERAVGDTVKLRHRAQAAEAKLAELEQAAATWKADMIARSPLLRDIQPDARRDLLAGLTEEQRATLYEAARIDADTVNAAYKQQVRRTYTGGNRPDRVHTGLPNDPEAIEVRARIDAARQILDAATAEKTYFKTKPSTPDLAFTLRNLNAPNGAPSGGRKSGNPIADAIRTK